MFEKSKKNLIINENSFDLSLSESYMHTDLLFATASLKEEFNEKKIKEPVALNCKWFTINNNEEVIEITGVTGAFYQPCADDIGMKIRVEASPVLGLKDYKGLPLRKEVGPLILDEKIHDEVKKIAESTSHNFLIKIDSISFDQIPEKLKKIEFPNEGIIEINEDFLKIKITSLNFELICMKYDDTVPKISMIRKSNNIFEILFDSHNSVKLSAKNNIERDIIAMTLRMISGEKILGKSEQKQDETRIKILNEAKCLSATLKTNSKRRNSIENYSFLIKVEQLTNEVSRHLNEKQTLKNELVELKERIKELENNNKRLTDQLDITTKNYKDIDQENEDLKQKMEIFISQKHFFLQEIDIYKAESSSKDDIIDKMKKEMNKLMPSNPNKEKLTWVEVEDLKKNTKDLTINISQIKKEKSEINEKNEKNEEIIEELSKKQEDMANEINYLRKKCESLAQEKGLTFNTPKKIDTFESLEMKNETFSNSNQKIKENLKEKTKESSEESEKYGNSIILNKKNFPSALTGIEEENRKLKDQIKQFEITIETLKITLSQEVNNKGNSKRLTRTNTLPIKIQNGMSKSMFFGNNEIQFLQKLANSLTETISDRELALESQKNISKELIKKVHELEEKLLKSNKLFTNNF